MRRSKFSKIEGIKELRKYKLPFSETMFVFNLERQKKEVRAKSALQKKRKRNKHNLQQ